MAIDNFVFQHLPAMHINHIYTHTYIYVYTHTCVCVYIYIYTHTHTHTYNRKVKEDTCIHVATNHCPVQWKMEILNYVTSQNNIVITT